MLGAYLISTSATAVDIVGDDLLTSSNQTTPWQECGSESLAIDVTNLGEGGCAYRSTPAEPGITYKLSCGINVSKYDAEFSRC